VTKRSSAKKRTAKRGMHGTTSGGPKATKKKRAAKASAKASKKKTGK
jgi:hypothetical protein